MRLGRRALGAAVLVIAAACTPPTPPEEPTLAETLGLPSDTPLLDVACAQVAGVCTSSIQAQVDAVPAGTTAIVRVAAGQYSESVRISAKSVHLVRKGGALDTVRVLKLTKEHPFSACVDQTVRKTTLPPGTSPIGAFTFFQ